jgi:uncharacterized membrane protein
LFYVPAADVVEVDISMEMALKLIMSAGVVTPDKKTVDGNPLEIKDLRSLLHILKPPKKEFHDPRD